MPNLDLVGATAARFGNTAALAVRFGNALVWTAPASGKTPPTLASVNAVSYTTTTSPKTVSVTRAVGDLIVIVGGAAGGTTTLATPTLSGVTFTLRQSYSGDANEASIYLWTGTATTAATSNASIARGSTSAMWGYSVFRFTTHGGVGASAKAQTAGAPSLDVTTTSPDSTLIALAIDWNAVNGSSRTARSVSGATYTERAYANSSGAYTVYGGDWNDTAATGSKTIGWSAPTGQKYSMVGIEVLGT